jgi:hypothetical protein
MTTDDECSLALSEIVLAEVSPVEVPLVEAIGPQLLAVDGRPGRDGSLGMGVEAFAFAVVVLPVANTVVAWLAEQAKDFATEQVGQQARALLDWLRQRRSTGERPAPAAAARPALAPEVARRVREVALRKSLAAGVDTAKAELIADAVAGALSVPTT